MAYMDDLRFLMRGLGAGALEPDAALESLLSLRTGRQEQRQERRAAAAEAQAGQLEDLAKNALKAAGTPTDMEGVLRLTQAQGAFGSGDAQTGLESLFLPEGQTRFTGNAGLSRIAPVLPQEDAAKIRQARLQGRTPDEIHAMAQSIYGPKTYARLAAQIDELISGTKTPPLITPPPPIP